MASRYLYVASAQKPTGVTHAVTGAVTGPRDVNLVLAKTTHLEIYNVTPDGLQPVYDISINGRIATLQVVRLQGDKKDSLVITTDRYQLVVLSYDPIDRVLRTVANGDLRDRIDRPAERGQLVAWDTQGRCLALRFYEGLLKIVPTDRAFRDRPQAFNVRLDEFDVIDVCFLRGGAAAAASAPVLAVLARDVDGSVHVSTYEVRLADRRLARGPWRAGPLDPTSSLMIPLPHPVKDGGVLVVGAATLTYHNGRDYETVQAPPVAPGSPTPQTVHPVAHSAIDATRYLVADSAGALYVAAVVLESTGVGSGSAAVASSSSSSAVASPVAGLKFERLGACVAPSCVAHLDRGVVFIGSTYGDSQLVRLTPARSSPAANGSHLEPLASFTHLGPIIDFTVMDLDRQGQGQIVAACNGYAHGSLRVIRSGIGIQAQAAVELPGIRSVWSLSATGGAGAAAAVDNGDDDDAGPRHSHLVLGFPSETRVFAITGSEEMEETELGDGSGFLTEDTQTLFCGTLAATAADGSARSALLQVTPTEARLIETASGNFALADAWAPATVAGLPPPAPGAPANDARRITVASAHGGHVVLALTGGVVVHLTVEWGAGKLALAGVRPMPHEVSCLHVAELPVAASGNGAKSAAMDVDEGAAGSAAAASALARTAPLVAVGLWTDATVRLLSLRGGDGGSDALPEQSVEALGGTIQPRSVCLADLDGAPFLLAGLGDGHLFNFRVDPATGATCDRKVVALGTQPITLSQFTHKRRNHVFAACDRPTVLFASSSAGGRKVLYSNVNLPAVGGMAPFSSAAFPGCLAFVMPGDGTDANPGGLTIGTVDDIQKLHVRTVPLGEQPRRVVHHRSGKAVAVAVETTRPAGTHAAAAASTAAASGGGGLVEASYVRLYDDTTFEPLPGGTFELDPHEVVMAMCVTRLSAAAPPPATTDGDSAASGSSSSAAAASAGSGSGGEEYIVLGTAYMLDDEEEPSRGRLVVLSVAGSSGAGAGRRLQLAASRDVNGGVFQVLPLGGDGVTTGDGQHVVAGINSRVQVFRWAPSSLLPKAARGGAAAAGAADGGAGGLDAYTLIGEGGFNGYTLALYLDVKGDFIAVGDLMKSVSLLRYKRADRGLEELAAEPGANWMTAVAMLDDATLVGGEMQYNLFTASRNVGGATPEERARLDVVGEFHLGDQVNRIRPGTLAMLPAEVAAVEASLAAAAAAAAAAGAASAASGGSMAVDDDSGAGDEGAGSAKRPRTDDYSRSASASSSSSAASALASAVAIPAVPRPRLLFGTVSGAIGAIITLPPGLYRYLVSLQRAIGQVVHPVGGLSHRVFRSFASERHQPFVPGEEPGPRNFIDGDYVEQLLDMDARSQAAVIAKMNEAAAAASGGDADGADGCAGVLHPDGAGAKAGPARLEEALKALEELARLH